jgi:hypothetical protein
MILLHEGYEGKKGRSVQKEKPQASLNCHHGAHQQHQILQERYEERSWHQDTVQIYGDEKKRLGGQSEAW